MKVMSEDVFNAIINFIDDYYFAYNRVPTMQQIADGINLNKSNVCRNIQEMGERGLIDISGGWSNVKTVKLSKITEEIIAIPIVGSIACGSPTLAEENITEYIKVPKSWVGLGKFFGLYACGNSMINAKIDDGDLVIIKQQNTANEGEIVVARIDDDATLKRYYKDSKKRMVRLHPENDELKDMFYKDVEIQGIAVKTIKDIK